MPSNSIKYFSDNLTMAASAARTSNSQTAALDGYGPFTNLRVQLEVTAASGTAPTLDIVIEDSVDGTTWNTIATFTQATGTTRQVVNITTPFTDTLRVRWTVGGAAPSFTFNVKAFVEAT